MLKSKDSTRSIVKPLPNYGLNFSFRIILSCTGLLCLPNVLELISDALDENELEELLSQLSGLAEKEGSFDERIKCVPWTRIKSELELLGKSNLIKTIKSTTLITKGKSFSLFLHVLAMKDNHILKYIFTHNLIFKK